MDFNFPSNMSSTGGTSAPFLQDLILKDYAVETADGLALSSVSPYDFVPFDLSAVQQGVMNVYLCVLEGVSPRTIAGAGIVAAAVVYGVWKTSARWSKHVPPTESASVYDFEGYQLTLAGENNALTCANTVSDSTVTSLCLTKCPENRDSAVYCHLFQSKSTDTEELATISESFHRQLNDALSRLDDVQYRLKELEKDKELLSTEVDIRKQMIHKLQIENTSEREKRQKAELQMEMMGMENSQIRQLRKEIDMKSGQVEKLEKLIKEKDDMQMYLFENNIVLPRNVVEARAKEFSELQNRVLQLQAEIDSSRRSREYDIGCQRRGLPDSVWLEGSLRLPALNHNEIHTEAKKIYRNHTPVRLPEARAKKLPNPKLRLAERSPKLTRQMSRSAQHSSQISKLASSPSLILPSKTPPNGKPAYVCQSKSVTTTSVSPLSTSGKTEDFNDLNGSGHRKSIGVFAQIRALVGSFRDNNADSSSANMALLKDLGSLLNGNRPQNNLITSQENPISDEHSVFMSASGGSDISDTDQFGIHSRHERKSQSKKISSLKRLARYRRGRRRDNVVVKRRLAVQYFDGQAHLIGLGESPGLPPVSREQSIRSIVKYPLVATAAKKANVTDSRGDSQSCCIPALLRDKNNAHRGDSWIVIIPKGN